MLQKGVLRWQAANGNMFTVDKRIIGSCESKERRSLALQAPTSARALLFAEMIVLLCAVRCVCVCVCACSFYMRVCGFVVSTDMCPTVKHLLEGKVKSFRNSLGGSTFSVEDDHVVFLKEVCRVIHLNPNTALENASLTPSPAQNKK